MPNTANFSKPIAVDSSGLVAQSVQYFAYPSAENQTAETTLLNAKYVRWTLFTGRNLNGTNMGTATWSSSTTVQQQFNGWTLDEIVAYLYPPPGPDN